MNFGNLVKMETCDPSTCWIIVKIVKNVNLSTEWKPPTSCSLGSLPCFDINRSTSLISMSQERSGSRNRRPSPQGIRSPPLTPVRSTSPISQSMPMPPNYLKLKNQNQTKQTRIRKGWPCHLLRHPLPRADDVDGEAWLQDGPLPRRLQHDHRASSLGASPAGKGGG